MTKPLSMTVFAVVGIMGLAGWGFCGEPTIGSQHSGIPALVRSDVADGLEVGHSVLHDYGDSVLVLLNSVDGVGGAGVHLLPPAEPVSFRSWTGPVTSPVELSGLPEGLYVLSLIGPLDRHWRMSLAATGLEILASAHPHALVVAADGDRLARAMAVTTSEGLPVIRGLRPLPVEARVHRSLAPDLRGGGPSVELNAVGWDGRNVAANVKQAAGGLEGALREHPEVAYVEPVFEIRRHNNLAARSPVMAVEGAWDLGYFGAGVTVLHNDSGVDLEHPDLADGVTASVGKMKYTDTAHGTHTAGSIVGRGVTEAPENRSGCGDVIAGLPTARGMAPAASLVTNNIFSGGYPDVPAMMAWGAGLGADLSNNSWGLLGQSGPETGYSLAAAQADAAVRDADPETPGAQPIALFFSAGNTGPDHQTVTSPGTAKNVITVGATQNDRCGTWVPSQQPGPKLGRVLWSSGRGPSQGRFKPDLVAPGSDVLSLESGDSYAVQPWDRAWTGSELALNTGTSQACALATGAGALLHEFLWRNRGLRPSPALLKAGLIVAAEPGAVAVDAARGWGRLRLSALIPGQPTRAVVFVDQDETALLDTGENWSDTIVVRSSAEPLVLAVVWTDVPGEEDADHPLVNDLDVSLTGPSGTTYRGNVFSGSWSLADPGVRRDADNNLEVVRIETPDVGTWVVEVTAVDVPSPPGGLDGQDFALVYSGDAGPCDEPPLPPSWIDAEATGPNRILVSWESVSGASRYELWRSTVSGGMPYELVASLPPGVVEYLDEGLSGGSEYYYVVRVELVCWSAFSGETSATATGSCTLTPVFSGIGSVVSADGAGCELVLGWEPAVPRCNLPVAYDIYRGDEPGFEPSPQNLILENLVASAWSDRPLEPDREYYYLMRARHLGRGVDDGNMVVRGARTGGPDDVYLESGAEGTPDGWLRVPGSVSDSGTEPFDVTTDDAWAGESAWFVADEDRVKDQLLMTSEPIELPAGTEPVLEFRHRYRLLRGRDGGRLEYSTNGGLDWQDILSGDGQTVPDDPGRWTSGGYDDPLGSATSPLYGADAWTGDSAGWVHSVVDLGDFAGRRVLLRWRFACDGTPGSGWGWWLDEIRLMVHRPCRACVAPDPPTGLVASPTAQGVALQWSEHPGAARYLVSRSTPENGVFHHVAEVDAPAGGYHDTAASGGTAYSYVVAVDDGCVSDPSQVATAVAGGPCELPPRFWGLDGVVDRREPACALDLHWRPAEPGCEGAEVRYRVYRSTEADVVAGPDTLIADRVAGPRYRDTTVVDSVPYRYLVRAVDGLSLAEDDNPVQHPGSTTGPEERLFADSVEGELDHWWVDRGSTADTGTDPWHVVDDVAFDGDRSWFCAAEARVKDQVVGLVDDVEVVDDTTVLVFYHLFDLEPFWDGGRLEYSTDGGASWHDMLAGDGVSVPANPERFVSGGYTGFVSVGTGHPFGGEVAWTGFLNGWTETRVELADFLGLPVRFRWRLGCDRTNARVGWWLDAVELRTESSCETVALPGPRSVPGRRP